MCPVPFVWQATVDKFYTRWFRSQYKLYGMIPFLGFWKDIESLLRKHQSELFCYISFSLSSFYQLSRRSDSAPNVTSLLTDYSSTCYTFCIYTYFQFQVFFLMFPTFTCAPVHPSTCFHFSFHVL